jgi:hypothetical protein
MVVALAGSSLINSAHGKGTQDAIGLLEASQVAADPPSDHNYLHQL